MKIIHRPFFHSPAIVSVSVFYVGPKAILPLLVWPRGAERLHTATVKDDLGLELQIWWFSLARPRKEGLPGGKTTRAKTRRLAVRRVRISKRQKISPENPIPKHFFQTGGLMVTRPLWLLTLSILFL